MEKIIFLGVELILLKGVNDILSPEAEEYLQLLELFNPRHDGRYPKGPVWFFVNNSYSV